MKLSIEKLNKGMISETLLGKVLIAMGAWGLVASFIITLEKIALLKNPAHELSCSLNPILSCGPIIGSKQASAFGFPNPLIGLVGFSLVICVGVLLNMKVELPRKFMRAFLVGPVLGFAFVLWLFHEVFFELKAICIYCMMAWAATWTILVFSSFYAEEKGIIKSKLIKKLQSYKILTYLSFILFVIVMIIVRFWYYWKTLF